MYRFLEKDEESEQSNGDVCFDSLFAPAKIVIPAPILSGTVVFSKDGLSFGLYRTDANAPNGYMSNYAPGYSIILDGLVYPSVEHYFQAQKTSDPKAREAIRMCPSAPDAKLLGQQCKPLPKNWQETKVDVMRRALYAKFSQHKELRALLLATGSKQISALYNTDSYWALGPDGNGKNRMGKLLMETRERLRKEIKNESSQNKSLAENAICVY